MGEAAGGRGGRRLGRGLGAALMALSTGLVVPALTATPTLADSAPAGATCRITGQVTDPDGRPVAGLEVGLTGPDKLNLPTTTDGQGRYRFGSLGPSRPASGFDPVGGLSGGRLPAPTGELRIAVRLRERNWFEFHDGSDSEGRLVEARTAPFTVTTDPECRQDVRLGSSTGLAYQVPTDPVHWRNLLVMFARASAAYRFATTTLKVTPQLKLPLLIYPWCTPGRLAGVGCPESASGTSETFGAYYDSGEHTHIGITPKSSDRQTGCDTSTLLHEIGHAIQANSYGHGIPLSRDRVTAHGGYYVNGSSADSWVEGWAIYFAVEVRKHLLGQRVPIASYCGDRGRTDIDLETNYRAWDAEGTLEDHAVAGLLLDAEDGPSDYASLKASQVTRTLLLRPPHAPRIVLGRVTWHPEEALAVRVEFLDADRVVHTDVGWVDDDGSFLVVVPDRLTFTSVRAADLAGARPDGDDDGVALGPAGVMQAITSYHSTDTRGGRNNTETVFDVTDLYYALRAKVMAGHDPSAGADVDKAFIAHGLFAAPHGEQVYRAGRAIGRTDHPERGTKGPAPIRYETDPAAALPVRLTGQLPDRAIVMIHYPDARAPDSFAYVTRPGPDGLISVLLPPESSGATVSVVATSRGKQPQVVATLDPAQLWREPMLPAQRDPLQVPVALSAGDTALDGGSPPSSDPSSSGPSSSGPPSNSPSSSGPSDSGGAGPADAGPVITHAVRTVLVAGGSGLLTICLALMGVGVLRHRRILVVAGLVLGIAGAPALVGGALFGVAHPSARPTTRPDTPTLSGDESPGARLGIADVEATATLAPQTDARGTRVRYDARLAVDGRPDTAWCLRDDGTGQSLRIHLVGAALVDAIEILPGYAKTDASGTDRWLVNRRITRLSYRMGSAPAVTADLTDAGDLIGGQRIPRRIRLPHPIATDRADLLIEATTPGEDTCISEVTLFGTPRGV